MKPKPENGKDHSNPPRYRQCPRVFGSGGFFECSVLAARNRAKSFSIIKIWAHQPDMDSHFRALFLAGVEFKIGFGESYSHLIFGAACIIVEHNPTFKNFLLDRIPCPNNFASSEGGNLIIVFIIPVRT